MYSINLTVDDCHPGYELDNSTQRCQCQDYLRQIERCDSLGRYVYIREDLWVGVREDNSLYFTSTIPGFLNCSRLGSLTGCLFKFDDANGQCASGRKGDGEVCVCVCVCVYDCLSY